MTLIRGPGVKASVEPSSKCPFQAYIRVAGYVLGKI